MVVLFKANGLTFEGIDLGEKILPVEREQDGSIKYLHISAFNLPSNTERDLLDKKGFFLMFSAINDGINWRANINVLDSQVIAINQLVEVIFNKYF